MFTIVARPRQHMILARLEGFFDIDEVRAYAVAAQQAVIDMGCGTGDWTHVCDISQLKLQTQAVAEAFSHFINNPQHRSRRLAIVTGDSPVRMQIRRVLARSDAGVFQTMAEAEHWLRGATTAQRSERKSA